MFQALPCPSRSTLHCGAAAIATVIIMAWVRPLGMLFLGFLGFWIYWTRCSFRIVLTDELRGKINAWQQRIDDWRHSSPSMFCLASSGCLGTLAVLGHLISGSILVLTILVVSALVSTKYNFKLLKIEHKDFQWSETLNYNNLEAEAEDEFLPDVNESNIFVLERASDVATISSPTDANDEDDDERSDDIPSELLIPDVIPEIDEHSTDEEDELAPLAAKKQAKQLEQIPKEDDDMNFRKGHFKRDSSLSTTSSSSEESLSKGLLFPDHTTLDASGNTQLSQIAAGSDPAGELVALAVKSQTRALLANSGKLLPSLVSGLVQWGVGGAAIPSSGEDATDTSRDREQQRIVTALDSSDESDFEILETDDFK
ncbi:uncharacterized protein LOC108112679 [Drosophila eugracilis]|uniref:uncharacterized protein LOC108112679 n=1 Tax=Drosophila eugracilis TaxID=29029 RepID=UPI0007E8A5C3|nr:uncharacterized protein LOC108112679 [Drosophila eugracilis]XP_017078331.1 uncharacterized protein LOC108112679 [Drosophila eugracilis]XP_017078342.1 uncharacterized protein LOC108112679 [Drosophila eugracilis]XP_017078353.1 uncharacterized protein LOC108112679 [Drosophila eugracilis]XP_017078362.1 uncharacterized protein LOC108112679 [Drosophila eugracilis]XP_017078370.1 uncharacterized protein LOC108112679 [Drosophila eugracilis]XP_017078379.1 uncharacterized protein LOC108112679 [Drosop